jgi:hypothetical protein
MKFLKSPTVCVRFIRATILVPSASRIWTLVVGLDWSTSNFVVTDGGSVDGPALPLPDPEEVGGGNAPGIGELGPAPTTEVQLISRRLAITTMEQTYQQRRERHHPAGIRHLRMPVWVASVVACSLHLYAAPHGVRPVGHSER